MLYWLITLCRSLRTALGGVFFCYTRNMNTWLNSTVKAYKRHFGVAKRPVVWDVGSRDGRDGVELAERVYHGRDFWADAEVRLVECNPAQAQTIRESYPQATVHEVAASDRVGRAEFMVYEGDEGAVGSSSLDLRWKGDDLPGRVITVETVRLESLVDKPVDIMKIDVEGHSLEALRGLGDKLGQIKVIHVETEAWTGSDKRVESFMSERGWVLVDVAEQWGGMPDQVWVNLKPLGGSA